MSSIYKQATCHKAFWALRYDWIFCKLAMWQYEFWESRHDQILKKLFFLLIFNFTPYRIP
jgi:hypothetical protein